MIDGAQLEPMITVSREYGAAGGELACLVAGKLGYSFFGQELVHEIARRAQVKRALVETVDERCRDRVERFVADLIDGGGFQTDDYLKNLSQVVQGIGRQGKGVIVGRAGHLLLPPQATLRVRVVAPLPARVLRVAARERIGESEARQKVLRVDAERVAFYRQAFNVDITNPTQFDVVINTGRVSLSEAAELIMSAHARRFDVDFGTSMPQSGVQWTVPQLPSNARRRA